MILIICASPGLADTGEMEYASNGIFVSAQESRGCAEEIHFTLNQYGLETQRHRGHREEPARAEHLNQFQHSEAVDW